MSPRPGWTQYYLGIADAVSRRAECSRRQVGAVIVKDHSIRATGYNGAPPGMPSCLTGDCPRARSDAPPGTGYAATGCVAVHAEANAIIRAGRERTVGAVLYVTDEPCDLCSPLVKAAGISSVYWTQSTNTYSYWDVTTDQKMLSISHDS